MTFKFEDDLAAAASSKAIHRTLEDLEALLEGQPLRGAGKLRTKLRQTLVEQFNDVGRLWYKRGFNRGHREAHQQFSSTGKVPTTLSSDVNRTFIAAGGKQEIKLRSRIKQRTRKKAAAMRRK